MSCPVFAEVELPLEDTELDNRNYDDEKQQVGGFGTPHGKIHIKQQINHDGEVNRARCVTQHAMQPAARSITPACAVQQRLRWGAYSHEGWKPRCRGGKLNLGLGLPDSMLLVGTP